MASSDADWMEELLATRRAKDDFFLHDPDSPIPVAERSKFRGLSYFPPNPGLRYQLTLNPPPSERVIDLTATKGAPRRYDVSGFFEFADSGRTVRLWAFRSESPWLRDQLFVPFRDRTSGSETYGGGRYLDIDIPVSGNYRVDLNRAYHPYCVYSPGYSCPLPPSENWLGIEIRAGERLPAASSSGS